ncbi:MAG: dicarboxylate/amino acid:cation symporter [Planctomycetota bacterium]|nr:MAG: dicarboxylate/amino acid:cation symporter [Planctomycetota bacterium]
MSIHWRILLGMALGVLAGVALQFWTEASVLGGFQVVGEAGQALEISAVEAGGPGDKAGLKPGMRILDASADEGDLAPLQDGGEAFESWLRGHSNKQRIRLVLEGNQELSVILELDPECARARWLAPFAAGADIFMRLLRMLIVPLILTSITTGVAGIAGGREFGRLGAKTLGYYISTSFMAALVGLMIVNLLQPGVGAELGLPVPEDFRPGEGRSFLDILQRMIPSNVFGALSDNGNMLQIILFSLLFGFFIGRSKEPHRSRMRGLFESAFEIMMGLAGFVLKTIPYGVFVLVAKVVGETGFDVFRPLLFYMLVVASALLIHSVVVLPLYLRIVGGISPLAWFRAMVPALMTAFSTSSSAVTLPVTMETVEKRGKVSNKITSFTLPLGATINMDGTALYECVGVIFLSQYYASVGGFDLSVADQLFVVMTALLASIGAAGIPSAGLVMMLAILQGLGLPIEGAALLLAIDRPLDMMRTAVNIWSDSCGAAIIGKSEGDSVLQTLAEPAGEPPGESAVDS